MEKKKFQKLKDKWYKKLSKEGFEDIENTDGSLKTTIDPRTAAKAFKVQQSTEEYYRDAAKFLHSHQFESGLHKRIWEMHCEGMGAVRISKRLSLKTSSIDKLLFQYKKQAGIDRKK